MQINQPRVQAELLHRNLKQHIQEINFLICHKQSSGASMLKVSFTESQIAISSDNPGSQTIAFVNHTLKGSRFD